MRTCRRRSTTSPAASALTGRTEDAIGHLRSAIERRPGLRDLAKEDTDLDPIREEPGFRELVEA